MLTGSNFGAKNTPVVNFIRAYAFVIPDRASVARGSVGFVVEAHSCRIYGGHNRIKCKTGLGVGANHHWNVTIGEQTSSPSETTTSYHRPEVFSIEMSSGDQHQDPHSLNTSGGEKLVLNGTNFGPADRYGGAWNPVSATFARFPDGRPLDPVDLRQNFSDRAGLAEKSYQALRCAVIVNDTLMVCHSPVGVGDHHHWAVKVGEQLGAYSVATTSYAPPTVLSYQIHAQTLATSRLRTTGDDTITFHGFNLGPVDEIGCGDLCNDAFGQLGHLSLYDCAVTVMHTTMQCQAPAGLGGGLLLSVRIGTQSSLKSNLSMPLNASYELPRLRSIDPRGAPVIRATTTVTIQGEGFGTPALGDAVVLLGDATALVQYHSETRIVCVVPDMAGVAAHIGSIQVIARGQPSNLQRFHLYVANLLAPRYGPIRGNTTMVVGGVALFNSSFIEMILKHDRNQSNLVAQSNTTATHEACACIPCGSAAPASDSSLGICGVASGDCNLTAGVPSAVCYSSLEYSACNCSTRLGVGTRPTPQPTPTPTVQPTAELPCGPYQIFGAFADGRLEFRTPPVPLHCVGVSFLPRVSLNKQTWTTISDLNFSFYEPPTLRRIWPKSGPLSGATVYVSGQFTPTDWYRLRIAEHDPLSLSSLVPVGEPLSKQDLGNCSFIHSSLLHCVTPTQPRWWRSLAEMVPRVSELVSIEVTIDDARYNRDLNFAANSSAKFFLYSSLALTPNATAVQRFAVQLSNIGIADFGYEAQLSFRSGLARTIGSNVTHESIHIESFALASASWADDEQSRRRRRLSAEEDLLTVRFQVLLDTPISTLTVNISDLKAAGLDQITAVSGTSGLTSTAFVTPRRVPVGRTTDWRVTVLAPGLVEGLDESPVMRFGELNASDVRLVAINGGQDIVMQGTVPHHDDGVVAIEISLNGVDFTTSKLAFVFERFFQV